MTAAGAGALPDEAFDRLAATEERSFWFRSRNALLSWALAAFFPRAASFLEVGCGNGYVLGGIAAGHPGMRLAGCELSEAGLRYAARRAPEARLVRADACELPFEAEFDVVGSFDVLEHIEDDRAALASLRRVVKPGGGVMITVPQHRWLWGEVDTFSGHQRRYTRGELTGKLADAGLRVRRVTSFVSLLLPAMVASRAWTTASRRPFDPARELSVSPRVDVMLERVAAAERRLIERGIDLPAGGSLLAITERP